MAEENLPTDTKQRRTRRARSRWPTPASPAAPAASSSSCSEDTELPADYTLLGTITKGLDIVEKVAKAGDDGAFKARPGRRPPEEGGRHQDADDGRGLIRTDREGRASVGGPPFSLPSLCVRRRR